MHLRWLFVCAAPALFAQSDSRRAIEVLRTNCVACHGSTMQMSGLRLDSLEGLTKGGTKGPVIVSGNAVQSRLIQLVTHAAQPAMPPGNKLKPGDIDALRAWIDAGAPWPKESGALEASASSWWSLKPPVRSGNTSIDE